MFLSPGENFRREYRLCDRCVAIPPSMTDQTWEIPIGMTVLLLDLMAKYRTIR